MGQGIATTDEPLAARDHPTQGGPTSATSCDPHGPLDYRFITFKAVSPRFHGPNDGADHAAGENPTRITAPANSPKASGQNHDGATAAAPAHAKKPNGTAGPSRSLTSRAYGAGPPVTGPTRSADAHLSVLAAVSPVEEASWSPF